MARNTTPSIEANDHISSAAEVLPERFTVVKRDKKETPNLDNILYMARPAVPTEKKGIFNIKPTNLWYEVILHFRDIEKYREQIDACIIKGASSLSSERHVICRRSAYDHTDREYGRIYSVKFMSPADTQFFRQFLSVDERRQLARLQCQRSGENTPVKPTRDNIIQRKHALWAAEDKGQLAEDILRTKHGLVAQIEDL